MAKMSWIGQRLSGRYQIEELLGQGGMSAVYKATDPNLKRVVAIKVIHSHLSDQSDFVRRFEEEAAAVAQLRHANIVQVYDFNHDEGAYYMVLEFVPGETLQDRLNRLNKAGRKPPLLDALRTMAQVCDAVSYAHERSMIHRDIKPANIMLSVYQTAVLMDFGIAKMMGGTQHTATGAVVGTAMYMSPEQIQGERLDERTDIYSLGVTLFEMIGGRPPYEADSAMTLMMMHINDPIPDIRQLQPEVPQAVVAILNKALAKKRVNRYASVAEMAQDLHRVLSSLQEPDAPRASEASVGQPPAAQSIETAPSEQPPVESPISRIEPARVRMAPPVTQEDSLRTQFESGAQNIPTAYQPVMSSGAETQSAPNVGLTTGRRLPLSKPVLIGGGFGAVALIVVIIFLLLNGGGGDTPAVVGQVSTPTETEIVVPVVLDVPTETLAPTTTQTPTETLVPTATETLPPTLTPTITLTPTVTVPPGILYVRINSIEIRGDRYVVGYETFEYQEVLPGMHVHFFWDTVSQENAGSPGSGPWKLYGGPRPFDQYRVSERPPNATKMCALVANANHSIQFNSGNCFDLPEG